VQFLRTSVQDPGTLYTWVTMSASLEILVNGVSGNAPWRVERYHNDSMFIDEVIKRVNSEIGDGRSYSDAYLDDEEPKTGLYETLHGRK
jgi:hypothetical protein